VFLVLVAGVAVSTIEAIRARQARQAALRDRDLAQRRFDDVHKLAREVIFNLQNQLAAIPGTTQVRRDLVAVAINYLDALAKDASADQGLQAELAAAYLRIGDIQGSSQWQNLGDLPAAQESYTKAERLARALVAQQPSGRAKGLLAEVLVAQANADKNANQPAQGAAKAMEALELARECAQSDPANKDAQFQLGLALNNAARFSDTRDSIRYLEEEASVFEAMLAHDPRNLDWPRNAALAHKYIAGQLLGSNDPDGAFAHLKRAEELDESSVHAAPNNPEYKMDLAIDMNQWGEYYGHKKDIAKAIQYTRASLAIRRELASADPKNARAQDRLAYVLTALGDLQLNVSAREALVSYQEARSIAEKLQTESLRATRLANSISGIGDAYQKLGDVGRSCTAYGESMKLYRKVSNSTLQDPSRAQLTEKAYSRCRASSQTIRCSSSVH